MANSNFFVRQGLTVNNATTIAGANGQISVGSNVVINTSSISIGNSTVNTQITQSTVNTATFQSNSTVVTVTGQFNSSQANLTSQTLTDGATITWDTSLGQIATVTLGGNRTMAAPTNLKVGTYVLNVLQDGTGSRTITWNAVFKWPAATAPVLTTTASRRDIIFFYSDGTNMYGSFLPDVR